MWILFIIVAGCLSGFLLLKKKFIPERYEPFIKQAKLSVIIPVRNEEKNLPFILDSLKAQTYQPFEIIVVDDFSSDQTKWVADAYGVKVIENTRLPEGWTGKTWAVWNGFLQSQGDTIVFLDADIRLAPRGLEALIAARAKFGGVISVVPYHHTEKFYERFAFVANILGLFAFMSPFESKNPKQGLYGACIMAAREDYEKVGGHEIIRSEILDDLNLGEKFKETGINVTNFIGGSLVSFRMYPGGIKSEIEGFSKGAVLSTSKLSSSTIILVAIWVIGLIVSETAIFLFKTSWGLPLAIGYFLYMLQMIYFSRYVGRFGIIIPVLHVLSTLFFILVMLYSAYQVVFLKEVTWKGRQIKVGGRKH